jgi:hypothetical protein
MAVGLGMAGAFLMMTACLLALFRNNPVTGYTLLILPIAVQELVLACRARKSGSAGLTCESVRGQHRGSCNDSEP